MEEYRKIEGFENYSVSNCGNVRNDKTGRILKPCTTKYGYRCVVLCPGMMMYKIHRLVGVAFIPNPDAKPQINHIDFNRANNNLSNLEWVTNRENSLKREIPSNTGYSNIYKRTNRETYKVQIKTGNKYVYCKSFNTLDAAIQARNQKYEELNIE